MEIIKIFNLVIMKKQWFNYEKSKSFSEGYMKGVEHSMNVKKYIIEELARLEKDPDYWKASCIMFEEHQRQGSLF